MRPRSPQLLISTVTRQALLATLTLSAAHALDWDGASTNSGASDGGANWNGTNVWWNGGTTSGAWVNGSAAVFGAGGKAGTVNLQGQTYEVSSLSFKAVDLTDVTDTSTTPATTVTYPAYTLQNGRTNLPEGGIITIASAATGPDPADRIKLNQVIGGKDITITHTGGATFLQLGGANQWSGTLTLDSTNANNSQFVELKTTTSISTLDKVIVKSGTTLSIAATGTFTGPELEISGTGANSRGALRIDSNATVNNNIKLTGTTRIATINDTITGTIRGNITGAYQLNQNSSGTVGSLIYTGTSTINELLVTKGNAQIGSASVGSITGNVTASGATALITGTGTINGNLNVTTGILKPGDINGTALSGAGMNGGVLTVNGNAALNLTAAATVAEFQMGSATSDRLAVSNNLTLSSTSTIVGLFLTGYTPTAGDNWNLITYGGTLTLGGFNPGVNLRTGADGADEGNLNLPDVSGNGLLWEVTLGSGALNARLVVPEPSGALLFGASGALLALRRRRKSTTGQ